MLKVSRVIGVLVLVGLMSGCSWSSHSQKTAVYGTTVDGHPIDTVMDVADIPAAQALMSRFGIGSESYTLGDAKPVLRVACAKMTEIKYLLGSQGLLIKEHAKEVEEQNKRSWSDANGVQEMTEYFDSILGSVEPLVRQRLGGDVTLDVTAPKQPYTWSFEKDELRAKAKITFLKPDVWPSSAQVEDVEKLLCYAFPTLKPEGITGLRPKAEAK